MEEAGRSDEAIELESLLDKLEQQYADVDDEDINPDDIVIDYDLEHLNDDMMDEIGMSEDDAQFAPDEDTDEESDATEDSEDLEESEETSNSENADNTDTIEMSAVHSDEE